MVAQLEEAADEVEGVSLVDELPVVTNSPPN